MISAGVYGSATLGEIGDRIHPTIGQVFMIVGLVFVIGGAIARWSMDSLDA